MEQYQEAFDNYETHVDVIKKLADHPSGLTHSELIQQLKATSNGHFSKVLIELEKSSFISFNPQYEKIKKLRPKP